MSPQVDTAARVWARAAAIRPVPAFAVVGERALRSIEDELAEDDDTADVLPRTENAARASAMDRAFTRFEETQPEVAARIQEVLDRPLDETALALGYFLSVAVWLAFDRAFGTRLCEVTRDAWHATVDALTLEEDLRRKNADEPLDLDDVLALEQPDLVAFVHDHIEAALETERLCEDADEARDATVPRDVDVDDVHVVYRTILLETLALSHAVAPGPDEASPELLA